MDEKPKEIIVDITLSENPLSKARGRSMVRYGHVQVYTDPKRRDYKRMLEQRIRDIINEQFDFKTPTIYDKTDFLKISSQSIFKPSKAHLKRILALMGEERYDYYLHNIKPDIDNMTKMAYDCCTDIIYSDDCLIGFGEERQFFAINEDEQPSVSLLIEKVKPFYNRDSHILFGKFDEQLKRAA